MKELQNILKQAQGLVVSYLVDRLLISRFDHFEVPSAEVIPYQLVGGHQGV